MQRFTGHTEQGSKIVKVEHQFLRRGFVIKVMNIKIVFKNSIANTNDYLLFKSNVDYGFQNIYF
jgi:hypothetical protein